MTASWTLRLLRMQDHSQLVDLWEPEGMDHDEDYLRTLLDRNPDTCFVIEDGSGRILAAALGLWDGRRGFIQAVAVRPEERGRGLGKAVVRAVVQAFAEKGVDRIRLFVYKWNETVVGFYENLGFEIYEETHYLALVDPDRCR